MEDTAANDPAPVQRNPFPVDNQGKIDRAVELKNTGNEHFKEGKYKKAITTYATALAFTKGLPGRKAGAEGMGQMASKEVHASGDLVTAEQEAFITEFEATIKTNIATCHLKLNDAVKALDAIREALAINPTAWKAQLRQAEASMMLHNPEKALKILDEASKNAPDEAAHTAIAKMREKANKTIKQEEVKQKKTFGNIFERARATAGRETLYPEDHGKPDYA
jgi:tetratricopeptide (TPR) repeat protein